MKKYILTLASILFSLIFGVSLSAQEFFRVAAHDSSEDSKKSADVVCTGEHDELTIQKVLDGFDGTMTRGCHILFYDGNYNIDGFYTDPRFPMPTALRVRKTAGVVLRGIDESSLRKNSGVLFNVRPQAYEGIAPSVQMNVIACSNDNMYNTNHLTIRNLSITLPLSGTSAERESYMPMYMQQYYDTDLEKLLIYNGSDWVDTMGNAAEPLKPSFDRALIPQPVFDAEPGYVELYWKAWEQAYAHVKWQKGLVQPLYMDEGLWDDTIWIWDSEFMVMFCKYAPKLFPGIQTLDNFYYTMLEDSGSSLRIQHPDNPPFFAWVENDYYKLTGDKEHIRELLMDKKFLQRYWDLFPTLSPERRLQFDHYPMALRYRGIGYEWNGISSGMDNTPRTRAGKGMLWVDAISQQALSALYISRLAKVAGDGATSREFSKKWKELRGIVNRYYWDDPDGCYYDIVPATTGEGVQAATAGSASASGRGLSEAEVPTAPSAWRTSGILTPASFWPMLAEIPSKAQARRMTEFALRPDKLGGEVPWVTVSRDDPDFNSEDGQYWRGAMWLPTAYMGIKALEKYDFQEAADTTAERVLSWMLRTYRDCEPHTIWECYSPAAPAPSSNHGKRVRPDFCGWSALGPISLFIENVLGFHDIDASSRTLRWDIRHSCRHGLNNLTFGDTTTDLLYDPAASTVTIRSNKPYCLILNGKSHRIRAGVTTISI